MAAEMAMRALAVALPRRTPLLPNVPTMAEAGLPDHDAVGWLALLAPAATPRPTVDRLNKAVLAALREPGVQARLRSLGAEAASSTPEELTSRIRRESAKWIEVAHKLNIKPE